MNTHTTQLVLSEHIRFWSEDFDKGFLIPILHLYSGQVRNGGNAYHFHVQNVVENAYMIGKFNSAVDLNVLLAVAVAHDVIEDHPDKETMLHDILRIFFFKEKFEYVLETLKLLTHTKGVSYDDYIKGIRESGNKIALYVKIADILDNLSDKPSEKQIIKYRRAIKHLRQ